jgi:hypothetical protein
MFLKLNLIPAIITFLCIASACSRGPKVISPANGGAGHEIKPEIFSENPSTEPTSGNNQTTGEDIHSVVVNEVLPTTKYVYLKVTEGNEHYWIATMKQPVKIGEKYYFKGGLLKTNFESAEYNRVFEKVYLVSSLVAENHGNENTSTNKTGSWKDNIKTISPSNLGKTDTPNPVKIAELVKDPKKYDGKTILISGECVKVNSHIMGRNWIHLNDGTNSGFDLVITSNDNVQAGSVVSMTGTVVLNKDFGAGYRYDIILENGILQD